MMSKRFEVLFYGDVINCVKDETGKEYNLHELIDILMNQQATITKLEQICETKMQEIEDIKYGLKEIAYKYRKEVQFKADTDPNQAVKEVLDKQQSIIKDLERKLQICSAHLLSDECYLTDGQIREIIKEMTNE